MIELVDGNKYVVVVAVAIIIIIIIIIIITMSSVILFMLHRKFIDIRSSKCLIAYSILIRSLFATCPS
jgi:hypothetical protein